MSMIKKIMDHMLGSVDFSKVTPPVLKSSNLDLNSLHLNSFKY
jgi:hypothetical protein